jgi:hypothetical protein
MQLFETLTSDNFIMYAMQNYDNPACVDIQEFEEDLKRFKYLKRLLNRYKNNGDLQERLILNHIIVIYNVFGIEASNRMMQFKIDDSYWPALKPFLIYLGYLSESEKIEIAMDLNVIEVLRKI